jgi:hypothetical protein
MMSASVTNRRREAFLEAQREADAKRLKIERELEHPAPVLTLIPGQRDIYDCLADS